MVLALLYSRFLGNFHRALKRSIQNPLQVIIHETFRTSWKINFYCLNELEMFAGSRNG